MGEPKSQETNGPENIYFIPEGPFELQDFSNQILVYPIMLSRKRITYADFLAEIKSTPIPTVEEYVRDLQLDSKKEKELALKKYPGKVARLDEIVRELNKVPEKPRVLELFNETSKLLHRNPQIYSF